MALPVQLLLALAVLALMLFLLLLAGARIQAPRLSLPLSTDAVVRVGLVQGPIHTDFLLPLDAATRADFAMLDLPDSADWLLVGWGARGFYTQIGGYDDLGRG